MKSPFPGMDPYLEAHWGDVHARLISRIADALEPNLPDDLLVRVEEHVTFQSRAEGNGHAAPRQGYYPDVRVEEVRGGTATRPKGAAVATADHLVIPLESVETEERTERWVEIIDAGSGNRIVTALELLSPTNKSDPRGRESYLRKQYDFLSTSVNLVEIDLLRAGTRVLAVAEHQLPLPYRQSYVACVARAVKPPVAQVYRMSIRERLPVIGVPLREGEADVALDLQPLLDAVYEKSRYGIQINYRNPTIPPLEGDDAIWADALLREKGLR
jgi:Protein of unknown function (DUF4058)